MIMNKTPRKILALIAALSLLSPTAAFAQPTQQPGPETLSINESAAADVTPPEKLGDIDFEEITGGSTYTDAGKTVYTLGKNADGMTKDTLDLPTALADGTPITWTASHEKSVFFLQGKAYILPQSFDLICTITAKAGSSSKEYSLEINKPENYEPDYMVNENFDDVEENGLPTGKTPAGTEIWRPDTPFSPSKSYRGVVSDSNSYSGKSLKFTNTVLETDKSHSLMHMKFDNTNKETIIFDFKCYSVEGTAAAWAQGSSTSNGFDGGNVIYRLQPRPGDMVVAYSNTSLSVSAKGWNEWKMVVDSNADFSMDFYHGKSRVGTKLAKRTNTTAYGGVAIGLTQDQKGTIYFDDIKVYTDPVGSIRKEVNTLDRSIFSNVSSDIKMPYLDTVNITWVSSNPDIVSADGIVNPPTEGADIQTVPLYAIAEKDGIKTVEQFDVTVLRQKSDAECVEADYASLTLNTEGLLLKPSVELPSIGFYGSEIQWTSSHPEIIDPATRTVTRPVFANRAVTPVTLTAVVRKGGASSEPKEFTFMVPEMNYALTASAKADTALDGYEATAAIDNDTATVWKPIPGETKKPYLELTFPGIIKVNRIDLAGLTGTASVSYSRDAMQYETLGSINGDKTFELDDFIEFRNLRLEWNSSENAGVGEVSVYQIPNDLTDCNAAAKEIMKELGSLYGLTEDVKLVTSGPYDTTVSWESSEPSVFTNTGHVIRPSGSDVSFTVKMIVQKGEAVASFTIPGSVKALRSGGSGGSGGGSSTGSRPGSSSGNFSGGTVAAVSPSPSPDNPPAVEDVFSDFDEAAWAKDYINAFYSAGYINGVGENRFEPNRTITREEFLKLLVSALDLPLTDKADLTFGDVPQDAWYYDYVAAAVALGITNGQSASSFGTGSPISRQDMCVMTVKAAAIKNITLTSQETSFADSAQIASYAKDSVNTLFGSGVISGYGDNSFNPEGQSSRAEAVTVLYRLLH